MKLYTLFLMVMFGIATFLLGVGVVCFILSDVISIFKLFFMILATLGIFIINILNLRDNLKEVK